MLCSSSASCMDVLEKDRVHVSALDGMGRCNWAGSRPLPPSGASGDQLLENGRGPPLPFPTSPSPPFSSAPTTAILADMLYRDQQFEDTAGIQHAIPSQVWNWTCSKQPYATVPTFSPCFPVPLLVLCRCALQSPPPLSPPLPGVFFWKGRVQRVGNLSYRCATTSPSIDVITDLRPPSVLHRVATKPQFPPYTLYVR